MELEELKVWICQSNFPIIILILLKGFHIFRRSRGLNSSGEIMLHFETCRRQERSQHRGDHHRQEVHPQRCFLRAVPTHRSVLLVNVYPLLKWAQLKFLVQRYQYSEHWRGKWRVILVSILLTIRRTVIFIASGLFSQGDEVSCRRTFYAIIHSLRNFWSVNRTEAIELKKRLKIWINILNKPCYFFSW